MFTVEQIKAAHSKVKSGADFPRYIQDLKQLGVLSYETYVSDGHTDFRGENNYKTSSLPRYEELTVAENSNLAQFKSDLMSHQQGGSDYPTFCKCCAKSGVNKWEVNMEKMTCTYFDKIGTELLVENIPSR